jgi:hypothetical protein
MGQSKRKRSDKNQDEREKKTRREENQRKEREQSSESEREKATFLKRLRICCSYELIVKFVRLM